VRKQQFWGRILRWLIPLAISGIAIGLVFRNIQLSQVVENISSLQWQNILLGVLLYLLSYIVRVFCWFTLLGGKVSFVSAFFTMGAGYLLNNVFPFRLGEIGRAILLDDPKGPSTLEVLSSVVVERIFDVFLGAVFILLTLPKIIGGAFNQTLVIIAFVLTAAGILAMIMAARYHERINTWVSRLGEKKHFIKVWLAPKVRQILDGLSVLRKPSIFILAFGSLALSWVIAFGENFVIFQSLHPEPKFWWMVFVLSAAAFGAALPSAPSGFGVFEGVMVSAFALINISPGIAFTHAIVIHAIAFVFSNIIGLIGLRMRGEAVFILYQRVVHRMPKTNAVE
jgi:uncharacterized protein (TIRG00374 family)